MVYKRHFDKRWVQCSDNMCAIMADTPPDGLAELIAPYQQEEVNEDREWLKEVLAEVAGPPGMRIELIDDPDTKLEQYAMVLFMPLPDSNDPGKVFDVGRLGYSMGASVRDKPLVLHEVRELGRALVLHEVDEWLKYQGRHIFAPH